MRPITTNARWYRRQLRSGETARILGINKRTLERIRLQGHLKASMPDGPKVGWLYEVPDVLRLYGSIGRPNTLIGTAATAALFGVSPRTIRDWAVKLQSPVWAASVPNRSGHTFYVRKLDDILEGG